MAALERKQVRLNGYISADSDEALFDAMTGVSPYKRMALLRRLANLGLMAEQGRLPAVPQIAPAAVQPTAPVAVNEAPPPPLKMNPPPRSTPVVSDPKTPVADRVVTAKSEKHSDTDASAHDKPRGPNLALMGRMNLSIMD
ncbi:hypothetical protein IAG25_32435 [Caballeronia sp. EK]|uniref:hypothetical protein n=1 Tax=Caballeronia sp. EK TaxID=2767469 RepID=UPI0016554E4B|nr:hypothetical protein [Caballeronia sp. EK]MBC8641532.1 hypothetical protein [Caballeronia sp. EK]